MKLTIVYDNEVLTEGLKSSWGFSCYIESKKNILFDTGWDGNILLNNMEKLGVDAQKIDIIVLSHEHWDHIGGVNHVLNETDEVEVYVPDSFSSNLKNEIKSNAKLLEVIQHQKISDDIYTTGELTGKFRLMTIKEQSLAIETTKGILVVTGCSHPDLTNILDKAMEFGKLYGVVGGFHGFNKYDALKDLELIVPTHCTQHKKEIKDLYGEKVEEGGVGWSREV